MTALTTHDAAGRKAQFRLPRAAIAVALIVLCSLSLSSIALAHTCAVAGSSASAHILQDEGPVADAGPDQNVTTGETIVLNGSLSTGFEGADQLNYTWAVRFQIGNTTLYGQSTSFVSNQVGRINVTLTVRDSLNRTDNDTMSINVVLKRVTFLEKHWVGLILGLAIGVPAAYWLVGAVRRKMKGDPVLTPATKEKSLLLLSQARKIASQYRRSVGGMLGLFILTFFLVMAIFAPYLAHFDDPKSLSWDDVNPQRAPPSSEFWFGTDFYGRDVWSLTVWGSRASLTVGLLASLISIVLGTTVGLSAGYFGKFSDELLMRLTDFFLVIPWLPLMIVFAMVMGKSFTNIIIVIGITSWPSTARIVRAQVLSVKEKMFIQRAICIGAGDFRIIRRHVLPNVVPLIFANTILLIANSIFSESFLEFFNLGDPDVISWGTMLEESYSKGDFNSIAWWDYAFPGACIVILIMAFYLIGDALDEVLNPKLRRR